MPSDAPLNRGGSRSMSETNCVKDKMKVEVQNPQHITMKNGKPALQGTCPKCGGKVFKIGGEPHPGGISGRTSGYHRARTDALEAALALVTPPLGNGGGRFLPPRPRRGR